MSATPKKIHLIGQYTRFEEGRAASTIKPGMLIEKAAAGTLQAHSTQGGVAERAVALEDALQGNVIGDDYSAGDLVFYALALPGDVVYMYLKAGENVTQATKLISAGDGTLIAETGTVEQFIGVPEESKNLTASGAVDTRIAVRII